MHQPQLTTAGHLRLQEQLETLRGDSRREALERVKTARKFCDFREDVTYVEAVREQERIETKIIELERLLADAVIVDAGRPDVVTFGSRVVIRELPDGTKRRIASSVSSRPIWRKARFPSPPRSAAG
ncbi:hypothetical protein [Exiguobacterium mexicanum]|uniref:hypothetical protein n=1 Tax=Exiguobacterium mexicanum TaxID=340146 RepID=UPI0037BF37D0